MKIDELENKELRHTWKEQVDANVATDTDTVNEDSDQSSDSENIRFHIQLCNIRDNEGLYEGMDWIAENMKKGKEVIEVVHASGCVMQ